MRNSAKWLSGMFLLAFAGCGGGGDDDSAAPDAMPGDVVPVSCTGATIAATVTTMGFAYMPVDTTISAGEIVRFSPSTGHDVNDANNAFHVGFGGDACFRFDVVDAYTFHCSVHFFEGTVTVQ